MQYSDFDLAVGPLSSGKYPISVSSEAGEDTGTLSLRSGQDALNKGLRALASQRTTEASLRAFGSLLYEKLFPPSIHALFFASLQAATRSETGMRIRLQIEPPKLAALPWEYLYSPTRNDFLCALVETPLVRYVRRPVPIESLGVGTKLSVLVVIPQGSGLDVSTERRLVSEALVDSRVPIEIRFLDGTVTMRSISDVLLESKVNILHFVGHGAYRNGNGSLRLNSEDGGEQWVEDRAIARLVQNTPSLKLIILNSCQGAVTSSTVGLAGTALALVTHDIPAVLAHQYAIGDAAAVCFARELYKALCSGEQAGQVDSAVAHARNRLAMEFPGERWLGAPVLYMRAKNGVIFDTTRETCDSTSVEQLDAVLQAHRHNRDLYMEQMQRLGEFAPAAIQRKYETEVSEIARLEEMTKHG